MEVNQNDTHSYKFDKFILSDLKIDFITQSKQRKTTKTKAKTDVTAQDARIKQNIPQKTNRIHIAI